MKFNRQKDNLGILVPFMIGELVGEITVRPKYNTSMLHYGLNKLLKDSVAYEMSLFLYSFSLF